MPQYPYNTSGAPRRLFRRTKLGDGMARGKLFLGSLGILVLLFLAGSSSHALAQERTYVDVIRVRGFIDPFIAQYVGWGIETAQRDGAQALIIQLDTPGGSDSAMRSIVQGMLNSPIPIVVYVSPRGARAGSAGVFITMAAHLAAMSPGTNIGAAHPIDLTGQDISDTLSEKLTNDAAAYIKSIAESRGRNAAWAEEAVRTSASITEREALEGQVIDLIADDLVPDLLAKLEGRKVSTTTGEKVLRTEGAWVRELKMSFPGTLLHQIVDPNIAYLLLTIGIWALVAEFYHPGAILPGVTGVICLILAFVAFGSLPVNWGGFALIILAVVLFVLDIWVAGFALSVGGVIAFILGSLMLFSPFTPIPPTMPRLRVNPWLIATMTALLAAFFLFALSQGIRAQRAKVTVGMQAMVGQVGVATSDLSPSGTVLVRSELWSATATNRPIKKGEPIVVVDVGGVKLKVKASK